jgi:hypothetical protein
MDSVTKKLLAFVFLGSAGSSLFAAGDVTFRQGSGGGTVTIQQATGGGGSGTPSGSNTNVQFNNSGAFGGDSGFQYDSSVSSVSVAGSIRSGAIMTAKGAGTMGLKVASGVTGFGAGSTIGFYSNDDETTPNATFGYDSTNNYYGLKDGSGLRTFGLNRNSFTSKSAMEIYNYTASNFVSFRSSATTDTQNYVLPNSTGAAGTVLTISAIQPAAGFQDGVALLAWTTPSGGGGGSSVYPATSTTISPFGGSFSTITFTGGNVSRVDKYAASAGMCPASSLPCSGPNYIATTFSYGTTSYWQIGPIPVPENFVAGSTFTAAIVWTSTATSGNVVWNVQMKCSSDTISMDAAYGTVVSITDGANLNQSLNRSAWSGAITPSGSSTAGNSDLYIQLYRGVIGSDTMVADARFIRIEVTYLINNISSRVP